MDDGISTQGYLIRGAIKFLFQHSRSFGLLFSSHMFALLLYFIILQPDVGIIGFSPWAKNPISPE